MYIDEEYAELMLPWYVNGTLASHERRLMLVQLVSSTYLCTEADWLASLVKQIREATICSPVKYAPYDWRLEKLMRRVRNERAKN